MPGENLGRTAVTALLSVLVVGASAWGLTGQPYDEETANWAAQARGQDIGNLLAVATLVLGWRGMHRGSRRAGVLWLGSLLYLVYAYVIYSMAVHFNELFLVYVSILGLSSYAVVLNIHGVRTATGDRYASTGPKAAGWTSIAIGVLFALLWLSELVPATLSGATPQSVVDAGLWVNPVHVVDLAVLLPGFVMAGYLAVRGRASGRFWVGPLLVFSVLMGISIVAAMVLMLLEASPGTWPPMIAVALVVVASLVSLGRHLRALDGDTTTPGPRTEPDESSGLATGAAVTGRSSS